MTDLARYQSVKTVQAGKIIEVLPSGCRVELPNGKDTFLAFQPAMTTRYAPQKGDWWVIYQDGYASISPAKAFEDGYRLI